MTIKYITPKSLSILKDAEVSTYDEFESVCTGSPDDMGCHGLRCDDCLFDYEVDELVCTELKLFKPWREET